MPIKYTTLAPYLLVFALGFILSYFLFKDQSTTVTTPPIIGKFEPAIPISQKPVGEPLVVTWKTETETIYIKTEGEVNTELAEKYKDSLTDERERFRLYLDAITYREFTHTFEDERLKLDLKGTTQGYLEELSVESYLIKPIEVEVPVKRFGIGPYIGIDYQGKVSGGIGLSYSIWEF